MKVEKPEGYSVDNIEEQERIIESGKEEEKVSEEKPDIIVVMNESFADLGYIRPFGASQVHIWNTLILYRIMWIKGHMLVSVIGGGTADTEYEFLTGHSIELFRMHRYHDHHWSNRDYLLLTTLKAQGYQAIAMHSNKAENWRRNIVYPYLGFDRFIDIDEFT